jgi:hypothetical protein
LDIQSYSLLADTSTHVTTRSIRQRVAPSLLRLAPHAPWARLLVLAVDVTVINLVFYNMLWSLLLRPLGFASILGVASWIGAFVATVFLLSLLQPWKGWRSVAGLITQLGAVGVFCAVVTMLARIKPDKGGDFSWLRVEVVKVPLWLGMLMKACPGYTVLFVFAAAVLAFWLGIHYMFSAFPHAEEETAFQIFFCGPLIGFSVLFGIGAVVPAFRMLPLVLHTTLIGLSYFGFIPVNRLAPEFITTPAVGGGPPVENRFGVTRLFPPGDAQPGPTLAFLRKMLLSPDKAFVSFGPTCGIYSVDRATGALGELTTSGLVRDMNWSPDGRYLWATDWTLGDFIAVDPERMQSHCAVDVFRSGLATPWNFVVAGDKVYVSNVSPPIVAELSVQMDGNACRVSVDRQIDFHATGYTRFTDGAFGLYVDQARNRLYVVVAMLDGRYEVGLVEIDLSSFSVVRDLRLRAGGMVLVPVHGRETLLIPSYYGDLIFEVSLPQMAVVRTIRATSTITEIAQDEKRGLFYASSRTSGELLVIDDRRGEVISTFAVGAKPEAMRFDATTDQLFLGSARGIFRIDLARFWASR